MAFDVNAARAQREEANGTHFTFTVDGKSYKLPLNPNRKQLKELRKIDSNDVEGTLEVLLGAKAYAALDEHEDLGVLDLRDIFVEYQKAAGVAVGEDSDSATS